jgi:thiol-disulfide isomerase/thioredoxin
MKTSAFAMRALGASLTLAAWTGLSQPLNDMFANRIPLTGTNTVATGSTVGATREPGEPSHAGTTGGKSCWWTWQAPSAGKATITTAGSGFDTLLAVYTGSSVSALKEIASNDDDSGSFTSKVTFDAVAGLSYQIAVDGWYGDSGTVQLRLSLLPPGAVPSAPAWSLPDPWGTMIHSTNYAGKVMLLDFWATWCGPCKIELPDFVALQELYGPDGLVIVGADTGWSGDTPAVVQAFLASWKPTINYQIVMATSSMMLSYGGIEAIPTTFLIDRQNGIRKKWVGSQSRSTFEQQIVPLLYADLKLSCQSSGGQLTLRWPVTVAPFALQSCTNPATGAWEACGTPAIHEGLNTVQVPASGSMRFFRLKMN